MGIVFNTILTKSFPLISVCSPTLRLLKYCNPPKMNVLQNPDQTIIASNPARLYPKRFQDSVVCPIQRIPSACLKKGTDRTPRVPPPMCTATASKGSVADGIANQFLKIVCQIVYHRSIFPQKMPSIQLLGPFKS